MKMEMEANARLAASSAASDAWPESHEALAHAVQQFCDCRMSVSFSLFIRPVTASLAIS